MDPLINELLMAGSGIYIAWATKHYAMEPNKTRRADRKHIEKQNRKHDDKVISWIKAEQAKLDAEPPLVWCAGCDELYPDSDMAFVDEDGDGIPDALYRCRTCRGIVDAIEQQTACNDRIARHYAQTSVLHSAECQCTNCQGYHELTKEQIENAEHNPATHEPPDLDKRERANNG